VKLMKVKLQTIYMSNQDLGVVQ